MLGTGVCGSRPRNGEIKWNQVVYQWCSRLGVVPVHLSKRVIEMGWKNEKWDGGECSDTCKAIEEKPNASIKQYLVLAEIHLDFDS